MRSGYTPKDGPSMLILAYVNDEPGSALCTFVECVK